MHMGLRQELPPQSIEAASAACEAETETPSKKRKSKVDDDNLFVPKEFAAVSQQSLEFLSRRMLSWSQQEVARGP